MPISSGRPRFEPMTFRLASWSFYHSATEKGKSSAREPNWYPAVRFPSLLLPSLVPKRVQCPIQTVLHIFPHPPLWIGIISCYFSTFWSEKLGSHKVSRKRKEIFCEIRRKSELCYATWNKARILKLGTLVIEPVCYHISNIQSSRMKIEQDMVSCALWYLMWTSPFLWLLSLS